MFFNEVVRVQWIYILPFLLINEHVLELLVKNLPFGEPLRGLCSVSRVWQSVCFLRCVMRQIQIFMDTQLRSLIPRIQNQVIKVIIALIRLKLIFGLIEELRCFLSLVHGEVASLEMVSACRVHGQFLFLRRVLPSGHPLFSGRHQLVLRYFGLICHSQSYFLSI